MPLFEYKGTNPRGGTVSGTLEAESHQAATNNLKTRGINVTLLRQVPGQTREIRVPSSREVQAPSSREVKLPSSGGASGSRFADLADRFGDSARTVLLGLVAVTVVAGAVGYYHYSTPWGLPRLKKGEIPRVLEIKGRVTFDRPPKNSNAWQNVEITFLLPEVPAQSRRGASELSFNAVGDYSYKLHYLSEAPPKIVHVLPSLRGFYAGRHPGAKIIDDGPSALVAVPEIRLHRARRRRGGSQNRTGQQAQRPGQRGQQRPGRAGTPSPRTEAPEAPTPETGPPSSEQ